MIVLLHFRSQGVVGSAPFVRNAYLFVDYFFVLSGFVIASSYARKLQHGFGVGRFMILRLGRIYPLHAFMLLCFLLFELARIATKGGGLAALPAAYGLRDFVSSLTLTSLFVGPDRLSWNDPSWSIVAEFWTYLLFAFVLKLPTRRLAMAAALIAAGCALAIIASARPTMNLAHDWALVRCMLGFSLGVLCAGMASPPVPGPSRARDSIIEIGLLILIFGFVSLAGENRASFLAPPLFAISVLVFARSGGWVSRLLASPPLLGLGILSYSIYMTHRFILLRYLSLLGGVEHLTGHDLLMRVGNRVVAVGRAQGDLLALPLLGIVIAMSYVTWRLIELPFQARTRAWVKRQSPGVRLPPDPPPP
jgi:peptidoglycan/LPS O-acetylase OafA/YrhL